MLFQLYIELPTCSNSTFDPLLVSDHVSLYAAAWLRGVYWIHSQ